MATSEKLLDSVLIANRGEIALRVIRACKELGIKSILAYSEGDRDSLPVKEADQAVCIGPANAAKSYNSPELIVSAAMAFKADAIHPGYGFLSEKADFVKMVEEENIGFVGPSSEHIRRMGDKIEAKKIAQAAGVPTVPGSDGVVTEYEEALDVAKQTGFPLLIKAAAGGGGRGMRVVESEDTLEKDLNEIMNEAQSAFNDSSVYIERYLTDIRHIEIQVLADGENAIALGERDCTSQRRNQKLIEEAPSPAIDDELRAGLQEAAINLCKEVGYKNAGTVEFIADVSEGLRQDPLEVPHPLRGEDGEVVRGVLGQQLAAAAARHDHLAGAVDADEVGQSPTAGRVQLRDQAALRAERHAVAGVLHVAAAHGAAVLRERGGTHPVARVRRVGQFERVGRDPQRLRPGRPGGERHRRPAHHRGP